MGESAAHHPDDLQVTLWPVHGFGSPRNVKHGIRRNQFCGEPRVRGVDELHDAVFKASGIGARGRLAEERQATAVMELRAAIGGLAAGASFPPVTTLDLLPEGVRFPLGWHPSVPVVDDMEKQSRACQISTSAAP